MHLDTQWTVNWILVLAKQPKGLDSEDIGGALVFMSWIGAHWPFSCCCYHFRFLSISHRACKSTLRMLSMRVCCSDHVT